MEWDVRMSTDTAAALIDETYGLRNSVKQYVNGLARGRDALLATAANDIAGASGNELSSLLNSRPDVAERLAIGARLNRSVESLERAVKMLDNVADLRPSSSNKSTADVVAEYGAHTVEPNTPPMPLRELAADVGWLRKQFRDNLPLSDATRGSELLRQIPARSTE
jgi:hypothetical protein